MVTGATEGLGKQVAIELAGRGATVLLHGRSRERLEAAIEETGEVAPLPGYRANPRAYDARARERRCGL
jgi:short-subunit dehydrogenase